MKAYVDKHKKNLKKQYEKYFFSSISFFPRDWKLKQMRIFVFVFVSLLNKKCA